MLLWDTAEEAETQVVEATIELIIRTVVAITKTRAILVLIIHMAVAILMALIM